MGQFELLQARQLLESNIAEFEATQVTKQDIPVAKVMQNSVLVTLVEKLWQHRGKSGHSSDPCLAYSVSDKK